MRLGPNFRVTSRLPLVGGDLIVDPVKYHALRLDDQGQVYAVLDGAIDHYASGLPFDAEGRLVVSTDSVVRWDQGTAFAANGGVCVEGVAGADRYDQGAAYAGDSFAGEGNVFIPSTLSVLVGESGSSRGARTDQGWGELYNNEWGSHPTDMIERLSVNILGGNTVFRSDLAQAAPTGYWNGWATIQLVFPGYTSVAIPYSTANYFVLDQDLADYLDAEVGNLLEFSVVEA